MGVYLYPAKNHSKQTVILSAGLGGHAHFWQPQLEALQENFQVLCYDHEGIAPDSAELPDGYNMQDMAQQVIDLLNQEQIERCHFIGHALGGFIGFEVARMEPSRIDKMIVINAWDRLSAHTQKCFSSRLALLEHAGVEAYVRAQALFLYPPFWICEHIDALILQENKLIAQFAPLSNVYKRLNALQQYQPDQTLPHIKQSTLVIVNQDDFLVPWQCGVQLFQLLPQAELYLMPTGAHASTVTRTDEINAQLLKFLNS